MLTSCRTCIPRSTVILAITLVFGFAAGCAGNADTGAETPRDLSGPGQGEGIAFSDGGALPGCGNGELQSGENCEAPFGPCCVQSTCRYRSPASECRPAADDCDVAELCSGISADCPDDTHQPDGTSCTAGGSAGHCQAGACQIGAPVPAAMMHWPFDNSPADLVGGNDASLKNNPSFTTEAQVGSHALQLNGSNQWAGISHADLQASYTARTVTMWINADAIGTDRQMLVDISGSGNGLAMRINGEGLEAAVVNNDARRQTWTAFTSTDWSHVAVVFDGNSSGHLQMFVDGQPAGSGNDTGFSSIPSHGNGDGLGARNDSDAFGGSGTGQHFAGSLDDVRIFDRALTAAEIQSVLKGL